MARWRGIAGLFAVALACVATAIIAAGALPQDQPQTIIRINVNLVQVDAVVTDSKGKPVTDLKLEDFELLQDGKPQRITSLDFVNVKEPVARGARRGVAQPRGAPANRGVPAPPLPSRQLQPQQIQRTIALVVDDLGISGENILRVRQSLKKWIETQMQPGDLVTVLRTSAGMGALQQFTRDKRLLNAAVDLVRYQAARVGVSSFGPLRASDPDAPDTSAFNEELNRVYSIGSMGAIQYIVQGLKDLPGRKSVVLFTESLQLKSADGRDREVEEALRRLTDAANRAAVVIYAIDPRGAVYTGLTAEDSTSGMTPQQIAQVAGDRTRQLLDSQEGMVTLTSKTGGLFLQGNDVEYSLREAIDDGDGYYLLGYQPEITTFDVRPGMAKFHTIKVRVLRPGLKVRSRTGFFGTPDRRDPPPATPIQQITRALTSPFSTGDVRVQLTTLYSHTDKEAAHVNALLHIDAHDLTFSPEADGSRSATVDIAGVTFDADGRQVDGASKTWRLRVPRETYETVMKTGIVYSIHVPVKKPGAYQMRVVLRDSGSQRLGSATQFVEVPDLKNGRLALSGIVLAADRSSQERPGASPEGVIDTEDPNPTAAVRIFKPNTTIAFAYEVLNAKLDKDKKHQLNVQTRLFRDGEQVFSGTPAPLNGGGETASPHVFGLGRMNLAQSPPGDYVLQVIVTDKLAKSSSRIAAQSMDFEVRQ